MIHTVAEWQTPQAKYGIHEEDGKYSILISLNGGTQVYRQYVESPALLYDRLMGWGPSHCPHTILDLLWPHVLTFLERTHTTWVARPLPPDIETQRYVTTYPAV